VEAVDSPAQPRAPGHVSPVTPSRFGDYELLEKIAEGGMGVVYRARQLSLNRIVAVKMIQPNRVGSREAVLRFRAEAEAAAGLHHPHIVPIHETGECEGRHYFSMDLIAGKNLSEAVRDGPLASVRAAQVVRKIAEAVHYAHQHHILHRDLKPSNVILDDADEPQVSDFGLARKLGGDSTLTLTGQVFGSPRFMPPEQASGRRGAVGVPSDVYGLGAILYYLLTGRPPFVGETLETTLAQVLEQEPVSPRLLNANVSRDLETICLKCLEKEPRRRYASAQELADELGRFLENKPIVARPVSAPEKLWRWCQRKPLVAGLAGGLLIACLWNLSGTPLTPLLGSLGLGVALAGWFGWRARRSARQLQREKVQRAIDSALTAAWGGDRGAAEQAITQAEANGAPGEWVRMLNGQIALYASEIAEALGHFEAAAALAPQSVAAKAMLATAYLYSGQYERYAEMLRTLDRLSPETPEDYLLLGATFVAGHADTSKAVFLLEQAKQKRPSGITFLQLALAEAFHAADAGSWPTVKKAMDHCEWASEILGPEYPMVPNVRSNGCNFALRLCPEGERAAVLEKATKAARALESAPDPIGRMQRAFYFQIVGDEAAALEEWRHAVQRGGPGLFAGHYAGGMLSRGRSAEGLQTLNRMGPPTEILTAVAAACLLLDQKRAAEAEQVYQQVVARSGSLRLLAEIIPLLAGQPARVATTCARLLEAMPAHHPQPPSIILGHAALEFLAGESSPEEFLHRAEGSRCQRCTAHHWIALRSLAQGDLQAARHHFAQSVETGTHWLSGFQWSRAFLARLEADPHWPTWIEARPSR